MRVVLTGASGQLGGHLVPALAAAGHDVVAWSGSDPSPRAGVPLVPVDLADPAALARALDAAHPDALIHAGALSTAEGVRRDPERARLVNVEATRAVAAWCAARGRRLVYTSTDLVFDGARAPYREGDPAEPTLAYGRSKLEAEPAVLGVPGGVVARLSLMYGPARGGKPTYVDRTADALRRGEPQAFFEDEFRTPLDLATAAGVLVRLLSAGFSGLIHVGGPERLSRFELARRVAAAQGLDPSLVRPNRAADLDFPEPRPADVSLDTTRLVSVLPGLARPTAEEAVRAMGAASGAG